MIKCTLEQVKAANVQIILQTQVELNVGISEGGRRGKGSAPAEDQRQWDRNNNGTPIPFPGLGLHKTHWEGEPFRPLIGGN